MQTAKAMEHRRHAIVMAAQTLLAREDIKAFSVRKLAKHADVSVATIYNLMGDRNNVLFAVVNDLSRQMLAIQSTPQEQSVLALVENRFSALIDFTENQEDLLRSANLAFDQLSRHTEWQQETNKIIAESEARYRRIIEAGVESGELRGGIAAQDLCVMIYRVYLDATMDWAYRRTSFKDYRNTALRRALIVLSADASEEFRPRLLDRISAYNSHRRR